MTGASRVDGCKNAKLLLSSSSLISSENGILRRGQWNGMGWYSVQVVRLQQNLGARALPCLPCPCGLFAAQNGSFFDFSSFLGTLSLSLAACGIHRRRMQPDIKIMHNTCHWPFDASVSIVPCIYSLSLALDGSGFLAISACINAIHISEQAQDLGSGGSGPALVRYSRYRKSKMERHA